jgi:transposase
MANARVEVITSVQRRRRWSQAEKEQIVAASLEPGVVASAVARRAGIHVSQLFRWRHELCGARRSVAAFTPVAVLSETVPRVPGGLIEIELAGGVRLRITGTVDAQTLSTAIATLAGVERRR